MRPLEREVAIALVACTFPPGSHQKRFARNMARSVDKPITKKQARYLCILAWRFRRQVGWRIVNAALDLAEERGFTKEIEAGAAAPLSPEPMIRAEYVFTHLQREAGEAA